MQPVAKEVFIQLKANEFVPYVWVIVNVHALLTRSRGLQPMRC
jgi:hypothetical protein